jgi:hypothetical protein
MKKIKVLPLDHPFKYDFLDEIQWYEPDFFKRHKKIAPIFNRNGFYYDRVSKQCWMEIDGIAFEYPAGDFIYRLKMLNHRKLSDTEFKSLKLLIRNRVITDKKIVRMFWDEIHERDCHNAYWESALATRRTLKEINDERI